MSQLESQVGLDRFFLQVWLSIMERLRYENKNCLTLFDVQHHIFPTIICQTRQEPSLELFVVDSPELGRRRRAPAAVRAGDVMASAAPVRYWSRRMRQNTDWDHHLVSSLGPELQYSLGLGRCTAAPTTSSPCRACSAS